MIKDTKFRNEWRILRGKALFKKGDKLLPKNYRLLGILNIDVSILEKLIYNRLEKFAKE